MELETNLEVIAALAQERDDQNWRFRTYLKGADISAAELDAIVHRHYEAVAGQIDCCACGNCCRRMAPGLNPRDIARLADGLSLSEEEVTQRYLVPDKEEAGVYRFQAKPCPLLSGTRCTVYASRPDACRSFPNLHKKDFVFRLLQVVCNCSVCPIVFNVYERLKEELWRRPGARRR